MAPEAPADPVQVLRERLQRHPPERQPLQHATALFHLGSVLLERSVLAEAEECFANAAALFGARGALPEQAKALNGVGATLRAAGRLKLAARALRHAAAGLRAAGLPLDEGAARFNLGLVLRESGDPEAASRALRAARKLLDAGEVPAQAAAAARELGATLLGLGELTEAGTALTEAVDLADRAGDQAGRGAAANALGLVLLAQGREWDAREAFSTAVAASPRALRPGAFAMAKANLAEACARAGDTHRARLAARQALGAGPVADPVRRQAQELLDRLGPPASDGADLMAVLESEPAEGRPQLVREELLRSAAAGEDERTGGARAWVAVVTGSGLDPADVAELWLGGLLELPPDGLDRLVRDALRAASTTAPLVREEFREAVVRAMVRFHVPQWMRLQDVFSRIAGTIGDPGPWR